MAAEELPKRSTVIVGATAEATAGPGAHHCRFCGDEFSTEQELRVHTSACAKNPGRDI